MIDNCKDDDDEEDSTALRVELELYLLSRKLKMSREFFVTCSHPYALTHSRLFLHAAPRHVQEYVVQLRRDLRRFFLTRSANFTDVDSVAELIISFCQASHLAPAVARKPKLLAVPPAAGIASSPGQLATSPKPLSTLLLSEEEMSMPPPLTPGRIPAAANSSPFTSTTATFRGNDAASPSTTPPPKKRPRDDEFIRPLPSVASDNSSSVVFAELQSAAGAAPAVGASPQAPLPPTTATTAPPPPNEHDFFLTPIPSNCVNLYVRMMSPHSLSDEELNRYFGRYGQVNSKLLRSVELRDESGGSGIPSMFRSTMNRVVYLQDFLVLVDSPRNLLLALYEIRDPDVLFVAPHDPTRNVYRGAQLDDAMPLLHRGEMWIGEAGEGVPHSGEGSGNNHTDGNTLSGAPFIPELIVDCLPYWWTSDQIGDYCRGFGHCVTIRLSIDDRSGAFTGAALIRMSTLEETLKAAEGLNGKVVREEGAEHSLICGVVDSALNIVSLRDGSTILRKCGQQVGDVFENARLWL